VIHQRLGRRTLLRGTGIAAAGLATAAVIGCASDDDVPAERQRLTFADSFEPSTYFGGEGGLFAIREGITSGLVAIDFDSQFHGALAESWETPDDLTWVLRVRSGVRFHNDEEMTPEHVAANLRRLSESDAGIAAFRGTAVEVDGGNVVLRTAEPLPYMPAILANGLAAIYHPSSYEGDPATTLPIGAGPFRITAFRPGDRRVLEAFDDYWGGRPAVAGVDYLMVPEAQTRAAQIRTGDADIVRVLNPEDVPTLEGAADVQVLTTALPRVRVLYPNLRAGVTQDVRVRRALAAAIERQPIVDSVLEGLSAPMTTLFRTDYPWGDPTIGGEPEDLAEATKLLAAAGYSEASPASITLATYPSRAELPLIAQVLQQQLQRAPFRVTLDIGDYTPFETRALAGELDLTLVARNPLFLFDPQGTFESDYSSTGSYNLSGFGALDAEIAATATIVDAEERYDRYRSFERQIIEDDVATIGLNAYTQIDAARASVSGYAPHPTDAIALHERIVKA
jgi:peptide/nickel transport system substrate-binding protein